ncbi:MAG TPA: hypothetical protein VNB91_00620 [Jatrophihabitantaceae bacterium]|nr:hypothetical protein [Jatrophihabitantaceae bacterium]
MSRLIRTVLLLAGLAAIAGAATAPSTAAGPVKLSPYHEPPWLIQRGKPVTLAYALLDGSVKGTLYVRNSRGGSYTRLSLTRGAYCPGDPVDAAAMRRDKVCGDALVAHVPGKLAAGSKLFYYAVLRDPVSGRSATVPAGGAEKPQRVWIVNRFLAASLGAHRFGHVRAPDAIVASAGPGDIGLMCCSDPPGGDGPSSFDIAPDGSIWVLDRLNHRLLVWRAGQPARPVRSVTLPRNLNVSDFALGRNGTIFIRAGDTADLGKGNKDHLYALTATGRLHWQAPATTGIATAQLQLGPDGVMYAMQACGLTCAPFGGRVLWTPLTTRAGRPLSFAERAERASPFEPLPGGLRFVTELSFTVARFALINQADEVVRAWRVTSSTRLSGMLGAPTLVGGDPVLPLEVSAQQHWEKLIVRLRPTGGTRVHFALADRPVVGEVNLFAPLRIRADGRLYQLRTNLKTGASVARYSLGPA